MISSIPRLYSSKWLEVFQGWSLQLLERQTCHFHIRRWFVVCYSNRLEAFDIFAEFMISTVKMKDLSQHEWFLQCNCTKQLWNVSSLHWILEKLGMETCRLMWNWITFRPGITFKLLLTDQRSNWIEESACGPIPQHAQCLKKTNFISIGSVQARTWIWKPNPSGFHTFWRLV